MSQTGRNGLLVGRDLEVAGWLERLHGASAQQIAQRFGLGRSQTQWRLQVLCQHGLVRRRHILAMRPPLYTAAGRRVPPAGYQHALAVSALVVGLERAGTEVLSEIELRRARQRQETLDSRFSEGELEVVRGCGRGPDVVDRVAPGELRAYEIELSSKGRTRREGILTSYAASEYASVVWIAPNRRIAALLGEEITDMGLDDFMEVRG